MFASRKNNASGISKLGDFSRGWREVVEDVRRRSNGDNLGVK
jgi:hypothetical protein